VHVVPRGQNILMFLKTQCIIGELLQDITERFPTIRSTSPKVVKICNRSVQSQNYRGGGKGPAKGFEEKLRGHI